MGLPRCLLHLQAQAVWHLLRVGVEVRRIDALFSAAERESNAQKSSALWAVINGFQLPIAAEKRQAAVERLCPVDRQRFKANITQSICIDCI